MASAGWATWLFASIDIFIVVGLDFFVVNKWNIVPISCQQSKKKKQSRYTKKARVRWRS